ncbi:MAG: hypothetical protein C0523_09740 [Cytophaga sp.]|nr:hypothetical protein [Cytophaga sp.]
MHTLARPNTPMTSSRYSRLLAPRLLPILSFCMIVSFALAQPKVDKGYLDARHIDLSSEKIALEGAWVWYDNQLLSPSQLAKGKSEYVDFPKVWNEVRKSKSGQGFATYLVTIVLPVSPSRLAITMPETYTSYRLWANGKVIAENGHVGKNKDASKPHWEVKKVSFDRPGDTLQLVLQISNFHHAKGGMKNHITLGESQLMTDAFEMTQTSTWIECSALALMSLAFLIMYLVLGIKKVVLYFSMLCLTWAVRALFSNNYVFASYFPDFDWILLVRIEYLTLYLTMVWCALFVSRLFPNEQNKIIKYVLVSFNGVFAGLTLVTTPLAFTQWLNIYLIIAGALMLYAATIIFRALINERSGSAFLTLCIMLSMLLFAYDIFTYEGFFPYIPLVLSLGYIVMFILMALALLLHINVITGKPQQTTLLRYEDLYKDDTYRVK